MKTAEVNLGREDQWLYGSEDEARALIKLQSCEVFDQADAIRTDAALAAIAAAETAPPQGGLF